MKKLAPLTTPRRITVAMLLVIVCIWEPGCGRSEGPSKQGAATTEASSKQGAAATEPAPREPPGASTSPAAASQQHTPFPAKMILQVPTSPGLGSVQELNARYALEDMMSTFFAKTKVGTVDGGDMGGGKMNVFMYIEPSARDQVLKAVLAMLEERKLSERALVAYSASTDAEPLVLWPKGYKGTFSVW